MATTNRLFDDFTRLVSDAAGAAQGVRREVETAAKAQLERVLRDMDVATREEVEVLREMVIEARRENEDLRARVAALEGANAAAAVAAATDEAAGARAARKRGPAQ
jgi:BMFP domain-containing protein YqiC